MPRLPDIGWQHGKMIGGHRHHVQCNYCHRTMIGGITRFKKHLASKRGEIKGCEAVPKEIRDIIRKHLALGKSKSACEKKSKEATIVSLVGPFSSDKKSESVDSDGDQDITTPRQEFLRLHEEEAQSEQRLMVETRKFFDAFSNVSSKDDQGSAPPRATDLGWAHGLMVNGDRQKIQCRYCYKVILGGGISRLKQHLAGERGNIAPCDKVPDDVKGQMQQHLGFKILEKFKKQRESRPVKYYSHQNQEEESNGDINRNPKVKSIKGRTKEMHERVTRKRKRIKKSSIMHDSPLPQPTLQESIDHADIAVAKFMYHAGIPFKAANSFYFQRMADAIAAVGPGYTMPSYHTLQGKLLNNCVDEAREFCQELRRSWEVTGCTVIVNRWTNESSLPVINFFVYCPKGTMFLKSVDASNIADTDEDLLSLFERVVQEVDPKNIVHFMTDSTSTYKAAGKLLMNKYKTFFWSACAFHCIELILEDLRKMDEVDELLAKAKRISQFIYNHSYVLDWMRKKTDGRDIVQPAAAVSTTNFLSLQNILSMKESLSQMFTSTTWEQSAMSKQRTGMEAKEVIMDPLFWSSCARIMKVAKPLITVLHLADSEERPSMGYLYDAIEKARKSIIVAFNNKESDYLSYMKVIDHIWEDLCNPLHAASYYLNPSIFYHPSFSSNSIIKKSLLDCIETLEPDSTAQVTITRQIKYYEEAMGDFSRPLALRGRESLPPATWWSLYASNYPELQRFAVRILSQTCSGTRCGKDDSMFERIRSSRKNLIELERLSHLTFVHHNLHLQQRQPAALGSSTLAWGACDPICVEGVNINAREWVEHREGPEHDPHWINVTLHMNEKIHNINDYIINIDHGGTTDNGSNDGENS